MGAYRHRRLAFVHGLARCHQLRVTVKFDSDALATSFLHFGPVRLPPCDASSLSSKKKRGLGDSGNGGGRKGAGSILFGDVVLRDDGYHFTLCTEASPLFFFYQNAYKPLDFLLKNADAMTWKVAPSAPELLHARENCEPPPKTRVCFDLLALAEVLHGSYDFLLDPLQRSSCFDVPVHLSHSSIDFVLLTCMLVRSAHPYSQFVALVKRRKPKLNRHAVERMMNGVIASQALQAFVDQHTTECLRAALACRTENSAPNAGARPGSNTVECSECSESSESSESDLSC